MDLTAQEAEDIAWRMLGSLIVEEGPDTFVVYRMRTADRSATDITLRMTRMELGRGSTRREALAAAGATF